VSEEAFHGHSEANPVSSSCLPGQLPLAFTSEWGASTARLTLEIADRPETAARVRIHAGWSAESEPNRATWRVNGEPPAGERRVPPEPGDKSDLRWSELETRALRKGDKKTDGR
jgi:hypothetical protein